MQPEGATPSVEPAPAAEPVVPEVSAPLIVPPAEPVVAPPPEPVVAPPAVPPPATPPQAQWSGQPPLGYQQQPGYQPPPPEYQPPPPGYQPPQEAYPPGYPPPPKKKHTGLIIGIIAAVAVVAAVVVILVLTLGGDNYGTRLEFNGGELYYTGNVTADEANRLGNFLIDTGFFDGDPKTVQLDKQNGVYQFRMVLKKEYLDDPEMVRLAKDYSRQMSQDVFAGMPAEVHFCDEYLKTLRVITP